MNFKFIEMLKIKSLVFLLPVFLLSCNSSKNDETGPVYRGEKGVVIRESNEDDRLQMSGHGDNLNKDSLMHVKKQGNFPNPGNKKGF
jgi:hypothetical protein